MSLLGRPLGGYALAGGLGVAILTFLTFLAALIAGLSGFTSEEDVAQWSLVATVLAVATGLVAVATVVLAVIALRTRVGRAPAIVGLSLAAVPFGVLLALAIA